MAETDVFERRLRAALVRHTDGGPADFNAMAFARSVAAKEPRRHGLGAVLGWRQAGVPRTAWVLLLLAVLTAATVGVLAVGAQLQRKVPAVVPPALPAYVCPPGTTPDEPGPVDQARPLVYGQSPMAFDRRAGKLVALAANTEGAQEAWTIETWTLDVCTNTWTRMHPNREPPALMGTLVYDVDSDLTIGVHYEDWVDPPVTGNVWTYDLEANTWAEHGVAATDGLRFFDPVSGLVFAGGWNYDVEPDVWTSIAWEGLDCGVCALDTSIDRIIEYSSDGDLAETRLLDLRTRASSRSGAETPVFSMGWWALPAIVYDEAAQRTVIAGDFQWGAYDATADRWEILYVRDPSGMLPKPRVYDPVNRRLLMFDSGIGDIVAFDLVTREWTVLLEASEGEPASSSR